MRWKPQLTPVSLITKKILKREKPKRNRLKPKQKLKSNSARIRVRIPMTLISDKAELTTVKMLTWTIKMRRTISWEGSLEGIRIPLKCQIIRSQNPTVITEPLTEIPQLTHLELICTETKETWLSNLNRLLTLLQSPASSSLWLTGCPLPRKPRAKNQSLTGLRILSARKGLTPKGWIGVDKLLR